MRSSSASSTCRLEWRPSRWRAACLLVVAAFAAVAWPLTAMPRPAAAVAGLVGLGWAVWRARRELSRPSREVTWRGNEAAAEWSTGAGTVVLHAARVLWRGPLATLEGRDPAGKLRRLAWWPDTLPPPARRRLRLATDRGPATSPSPTT